MCLACLRRLAWVLVLVLCTGLAAPAFAAAPSPSSGLVAVAAAHVHADGSTHAHGKQTAAGMSEPGEERPPKSPHHCPGCLTGAECAIACLGVGLLPTSMPVPTAVLVAKAWTVSAKPSPLGTMPAGDLDPPKPVPVR